MKLTVVVDNNTYIDQYYWGEPALCLYIEDGDRRILFDTGYSEIFMHNAALMGIDLNTLTDIAVSHGHNDHTGGLRHFWEAYDLHNVRLVSHPDAFLPKESEGLEIGAPFRPEELKNHIDWQPSRSPVRLSDHITWLGEIPRTVPFENGIGIGRYRRDNLWLTDDLADDTAMVYEGEKGLFIITGCSHSGICNILSYTEALFPGRPITGILGGFHLLKDDTRLRQTIQYLKAHTQGTLYPCHCVCLQARHRMMNELPVAETATGLVLDIQ